MLDVPGPHHSPSWQARQIPSSRAFSKHLVSYTERLSEGAYAIYHLASLSHYDRLIPFPPFRRRSLPPHLRAMTDIPERALTLFDARELGSRRVTEILSFGAVDSHQILSIRVSCFRGLCHHRRD